MAAHSRSAAAVVEAFVGKCERRTLAVLRDSPQRLAEEANTPRARGGKMPVDTGFLRNSQLASLNGLPGWASNPVGLVLTQMRIGDSIWIGWVANYSRHMEARYGFMRAAAQRWPQIVNESARAVKARIK